MSDFREYIQHLDASAPNPAAPGPRIQSWDELYRWMDLNLRASLQPALRRLSIIPPVLQLSWKHRFARSVRDRLEVAAAPKKETGWRAVVEYRRRVTLVLTIVTTIGMVMLSASNIRAEQMPEASARLYLAIYGLMTYFLAANFYKLVLGTWHTFRGAAANPWHPSKFARDPAPSARVAIVYPVYHENAARVAAGMAATWNSIARDFPQFAGHFDQFLLSDSRKTEYWIAEESAVQELRNLFPEGRFFYRRRPTNFNAKLGNIIDFCRRWGLSYDYMLVMDADSVMDGQAVVSLLRNMEGNPQVGILQTNPKPVLRHSLFGRMQQFAARLYGTVFSYSLQAMHMGHASYIGHNAMIRLKPFIESCVLPKLSGKTPWGGKPLSHDIVESALMARAGYEVWFLPEIEGSYEEIPANILDFLIRERRWMQGNLQHLRFLFLQGLQSTHRETFLHGSMGYLSAPLWALFLVVSGYGMVHFLESGRISIGTAKSIEAPMIMLLISSIVFLFMPRLLAFVIHIRQDRARLFGGKDKLVWSMLLETVFSFFFSPIVMVYISRFLWQWTKRRSISWGAQRRDDDALSWAQCFQHFGWVSTVGIICWALLGYRVLHVSEVRSLLLQTVTGGWINPGVILLWFFPIVAGLAGSVLIVRLTSKTLPLIRACNLFCIPEEIETPPVIEDMLIRERHFSTGIPDPNDKTATIAYAMQDRGFYIRHRPETRLRPHVAKALLPKIDSGLALTDREVLLALSERQCFDALHRTRMAS
jgi:membrane glycosyltransferase